MLEVDNISKHYGDLKALDEVSFEVEKGEILGFLGPNGAGKTTMMRILTCFTSPTDGKSTVGGFDVVKDSMEVRKRIGYLPEHPPLYDNMTVSAFLKFAADIKGVPSSSRERQIEKVVEECGLEDVFGRLIENISKGYKQRVALAQALIHDPPVLILDEPTVGLDPNQIKEIRDHIKDLAGERTIILSTHILPEVTMTCDRVVIIDEGKIVAQDSQEALSRGLSETEKIYVELEDFSSSEEVTSEFKEMDGVLDIAKDREGFTIETEKDTEVKRRIAPFIVQKDWTLLEMRIIEKSLEDVFVELTTKEETETI